MANETPNYRGTVEVELDKPRLFHLNYEALELIEKTYNKGSLDLDKLVESGWELRIITFWAGLKTYEPELTLEYVKRLVGLCDTTKMGMAIMASVLGGKLPDPKPEAELKNVESPAANGEPSQTISAGLSASA